jgi:hypothetical protein
MIKPARRLLPFLFLALQAMAPARAAEQNRSVHIIEDAPAVAPAENPSIPTTLPEPVRRPPKKNLEAMNIEVLPQRDFLVGQQISFRVTAEKSGYLVLVDVDAQGKLSQIYPNLITLSDPRGFDEKSNFLKAGRSVVIPDLGANAAFRFVASPPAGVGMVVAILSDTPVQVIDLPDVPLALAGKSAAADFIRATTHSLQILPAGKDAVSKRTPKWTFATQFYGIR